MPGQGIYQIIGRHEFFYFKKLRMPLIVREDLSYEPSSSKSFTPSAQGHQEAENHGITGGVIAAIVIASIIIIAAICAIMTYVIRTRRDKMEERKSSRFANSIGKKNVSPTLINARSKLREKISSDSPPLSIKSPSSASSFGEKGFYDEEEDFGNLKTPLPKLLHGFEVNSESYSLVTPSPTNSTFATQQMASLKSPSYPSIPSTPTYIDDLPQSPLESPTADVRTVKLSFVPTMADEIAVMTGDTVLLLKEWDDGWAFVVKLNKEGEFKEEGVIPLESLVDKTPQSRNFTQSVKSIPSRMSLTKPSMSSLGSRRSGVRHSSIRV